MIKKCHTNKSEQHSWINWPNTNTKKCTRCGMMVRKKYKNKTGVNTMTYEKNGIEYKEWQPCKIPNYETD